MLIRDETEADQGTVHALHLSAFDTSSEANLVDVLREQATPFFSLVAGDEENVVGHIMFSPVSLSGHTNLKLMGLAPMAVKPEHQRKGVGSALVREGLGQCKRSGVAAVVVLGYPEFYRRFGFVCSSRFDIKSEYDVPEDVFMVVELLSNSLRGKSGMVKYHAAFKDL